MATAKINPHTNKIETDTQQGLKVEPQTQVKQPPNFKLDATIVAYMMILETVQVQHDTAQLQASYLQANAEAQDKLISEQSSLQYKTVDRSQLYEMVDDDSPTPYAAMTGAGRASGYYNNNMAPPGKHEQLRDDADIILKQTELDNQLITQKLTFIDDYFSLARQNAQLTETDLNTSINENQQSIQEGASLLQMLTTLTQLIER